MHTRQTGAALIVALILLMVMTLLGVSTVRTTVTGERMAGHFFNKQASFDAAEAALRDGEDAATAIALFAPTDGTDGIYLPNPTGAQRWEDSATVWETRTGTALGGVAQQPSYIAEYLGGVPRDDNCLLDSDASTNQDCWRYAYRVSGRGWGANTNAVSVTQSTILTRK
ncbi:MAG: pilus assembly PilX family protein [Gammaproteobacteria bacterium]